MDVFSLEEEDGEQMFLTQTSKDSNSGIMEIQDGKDDSFDAESEGFFVVPVYEDISDDDQNAFEK